MSVLVSFNEESGAVELSIDRDDGPEKHGAVVTLYLTPGEMEEMVKQYGEIGEDYRTVMQRLVGYPLDTDEESPGGGGEISTRPQ